MNSPDATYNVILLGFWSHAEITFGIMISCFPVLPRLIQTFHSQARNAFSSRFKDCEMSFCETLTSRFSFVSAAYRDRGAKKNPGGFIDPYDSRTESSSSGSKEKKSPSQKEQELTQSGTHSRIDLSRESLSSTRSCSYPGGESGTDTKQPQGGQILMTTHIETEIESHVDARDGSRTDLERQKLGW